MSKNVQPGGLNSPGGNKNKQKRQSGAKQPVPDNSAGRSSSNEDVFQMMIDKDLQEPIADFGLVDDDRAQACICGQCGTASGDASDFSSSIFNKSTKQTSRSAQDDINPLSPGTPVYFIEVRANSDPVVLDEETVHSGSTTLVSADRTTFSDRGGGFAVNGDKTLKGKLSKEADAAFTNEGAAVTDEGAAGFQSANESLSSASSTSSVLEPLGLVDFDLASFNRFDPRINRSET